MAIQAVGTSFQGDKANQIKRGLKKTILDSSDVRNKDAAVGGAVAAGSVGGAAAVANRLTTMRNLAQKTQHIASKAKALNARNLSILEQFVSTVTKFFKTSKSTAWIARALETPAMKRASGVAGGLLALGITGAQLYSAGDMAVDAIDTYSK